MTVHDLSVLDRPELIPSPASRWYWSQWLAWSAQHADVLVTPSSFTADRLMRRLGIPARSIVTLPHPPRSIFERASRTGQLAMCSHLRISPPFCLGVGALEPRKDWEGVLAAFARVAQRVPHRLVLAGPVNVPASRERLQHCIRRLGLEQRVQWLGYVPLHWLPALYSSADLLIFPETYAGYGLPVLEAMACGTPVITYDNTALPETAGDAALLLPSPWSAEVLAEMVLHVLQSAELRAEMGRRGLARVRRLSWEETADCLAVIYTAASKRSPSRSGKADAQPTPRHRTAGAGKA
jgi:glycosyltransferase involved in cell wall biosynthesis